MCISTLILKLPIALIICNIGQAQWYMPVIPMFNYKLEDRLGYVVRPCHHKQNTMKRLSWGKNHFPGHRMSAGMHMKQGVKQPEK